MAASCTVCRSTVTVLYDRGQVYVSCNTCAKRRRMQHAEGMRAIEAVFPALACSLGRRLFSAVVCRYKAEALTWLRTASDAELLALTNVGPRMVALLRSVVPRPSAPPRVVAPDDCWGEHAAMVALEAIA